MGQGSDVSLDLNEAIPNSPNGKFPRVAVSGNTLGVAVSTGEKATFWSKQDSADTFPIRQEIGDADKGTSANDYANTDIAVGPDGSFNVVWISQGQGIFFRQKPSGGDWGPERTVLLNGSFRAYVHIAVSQGGTIGIVWNEANAVHYRVSTNGGVSWSGDLVANISPLRHPQIAGGPGQTLMATWGTVQGTIYAAFWNGSSWQQETIAAKAGSYFEPSGAIGPDGTAYAVWREIGQQIYFSQRSSNGTWINAVLAPGDANGFVSIAADTQNNLHVAWASPITGQPDIFYAFRPTGGDWKPVLRVTNGGRVAANADVAGNLGERIFGHVTVEVFSGDGMLDRYVRASSLGLSALPKIENGVQYTNKSTVQVQLTNVQGGPDQVRYRWGAAPTDADSWQSLDTSNPVVSVAAPSDLDGTCKSYTLYTQVRKSSGNVVGAVSTASITFDTAVQGDLLPINPFMSTARLATQRLGIQGAVEQGGAEDGAPNYTRTRQIFLNFRNAGDCSGLSAFEVTGSIGGDIDNEIGQLVPLPGDSSIGMRSIEGQLSDSLGNTRAISTWVIYDPGDTDPTEVINTDGLPVVSETTTATVDLQNRSIIREINFADVSVNDNLYGKQGENLPDGQQFWGVWIANSREQLDPNDISLRYFPVKVATPAASFSVEWNLFTGLNYGPATDKQGIYYLYIRFLDGAGNASARTLVVQAQLEPGYNLPGMRLPMVKKGR
ncbi:MAG: sialidase family protein [Roseiflexaceae bacterium]